MKTLFHSLAAIALVGSLPLYAQESAAGIDTIRADTSAIAQQMDAKNAAVLAILQKLTVCNAKKRFYQPAEAAADADGCVVPDSVAPTLSAYYFAKCDTTTALGGRRPNTQLHPAGVWPSSYSVNYSVAPSSGAMPDGTYEAMGHCTAPGATLWRRVPN